MNKESFNRTHDQENPFASPIGHVTHEAKSIPPDEHLDQNWREQLFATIFLFTAIALLLGVICVGQFWM